MITKKIGALLFSGLLGSMIFAGAAAYAEGGAPLKAPIVATVEYHYNAEGSMQVISTSGANTMMYVYDLNGNLVHMVVQ